MNFESVNRLSSDDVSDVAAEFPEVNRNPENYSGELILSLCGKRNAAGSPLASYLKKVFPFFGDAYAESGCIEGGNVLCGNIIYEKEKRYLTGIEKLIDYIALNDAVSERVFELLSYQRAMLNEYRKIILLKAGSDALSVFNKFAAANKSSNVRQIGFAPSFRCNLACEYCFSAQKRTDDADDDLVNYILTWAQKENVRRLRLYGGEPTVFGGLRYILNRCKDAGIGVYFASNCIIPGSVMNSLESDDVELIFAHVRGPGGKHSDMYDLFWKNVNTLGKKKIRVILRYNLEDEDWNYIFDNAEGNVCETVSFAPAVSYGTLGSISDEEWKARIELIEKFYDFASLRGFKAVLARPQPMCYSEQYSSSARWDLFSGTCSAYLNDYTFNVLVWPDGKIALCDGALRPTDYDIRRFGGWSEYSSFVESGMRKWLDAAAFGKCGSCYYKKRALCQGSCLAARTITE